MFDWIKDKKDKVYDWYLLQCVKIHIKWLGFYDWFEKMDKENNLFRQGEDKK